MKRQLRAILYYLVTDIRYSFSVFWMVIGAFLLLSVVIEFILGTQDSNTIIHFNFSFPIYIFASVVGYLTVKKVMTYLIKMGATRKMIFIGVFIFFIGLSIVNALISNSLDALIRFVVKSDIQGGIVITDGLTQSSFHHIADFIGKNNILNQIIVDSAISFFFIIVYFLIGLIFYRFGLIGGIIFVGIIIFTFIFGMANGWLIDFFIDVFRDFSIVFFYQLSLVGFVVYLITYLLLRRFTIN